MKTQMKDSDEYSGPLERERGGERVPPRGPAPALPTRAHGAAHLRHGPALGGVGVEEARRGRAAQHRRQLPPEVVRVLT